MGAGIVSQPPPASAAEARAHFTRRLSLETDCADVHAALRQSADTAPDFVLLDVRGPEAYAQAHVPGALNLPHGLINSERISCWPPERVCRCREQRQESDQREGDAGIHLHMPRASEGCHNPGSS
jgi:3-mercaptopyruvate sulfurtransferase SseA